MIKEHKLANLIKVADRLHNVEDLDNMKNIPKYIKETKDFVYPMITYGKLAWPKLSNGFTILKSKIMSLTESTEALVSIYEARIAELETQLNK